MLASRRLVPIRYFSPHEEPVLGGDSVGKTLNVSYIEQTQSQWCWAAVIQMGLELFGNEKKTQCELANNAFDSEGCCALPSSSVCNNPLRISKIAIEWKNYGCGSDFISDKISFKTIKSEIDEGRPIEIGFKWDDAGGHAVLLIGWTIVDGNEIVIINDPSPKNGGVFTIPYKQAITAYGRGQWKWTWKNIFPV